MKFQPGAGMTIEIKGRWDPDSQEWEDRSEVYGHLITELTPALAQALGLTPEKLRELLHKCFPDSGDLEQVFFADPVHVELDNRDHLFYARNPDLCKPIRVKIIPLKPKVTSGAVQYLEEAVNHVNRMPTPARVTKTIERKHQTGHSLSFNTEEELALGAAFSLGVTIFDQNNGVEISTTHTSSWGASRSTMEEQTWDLGADIAIEVPAQTGIQYKFEGVELDLHAQLGFTVELYDGDFVLYSKPRRLLKEREPSHFQPIAVRHPRVWPEFEHLKKEVESRLTVAWATNDKKSLHPYETIEEQE